MVCAPAGPVQLCTCGGGRVQDAPFTARCLCFLLSCRAIGITVPILPGLMPIMTYGGFKRMTAFCKTRVPAHISDTVELLKDNDEALKVGRVAAGGRNVLLSLAAAARTRLSGLSSSRHKPAHRHVVVRR